MTHITFKAAIPSRAAPVYPNIGTNENEIQRLPKTTPRERLILFAIGDQAIYGLAIQKAIEECSNGTEKISIGSLYPTLHSLEKKELVISEFGDTPSDERCGARRRYYSLTETGKAVVQDILDFQNRLLSWEPK
ncbi:MAG: PadR family transcriptional regulator [Cyanobacteria bacterium P01_F01_bin.116]